MGNEEILNILPNNKVRQTLIEIIEKNVTSKYYSLEMEQGAAKGDNYVGVVHRLSVTYKESENDASEPQKFGIFIKVPPENLARRQQFGARPCFLREALMYDEYLPLLAEFQQSKGIIPEKNGFNEFAICYQALTEEPDEAVFMEDLSLKGFTMFSRFETPSIGIVRLVMRALGKLHALSFAIKDQCPQQIAKYKDMDDIFVREDELLIKYINSLDKVAFDSLLEEGDEKYREKMNEFLKKKTFSEHLKEIFAGSSAEPYAVVCHGDCWNNNILFKHEDGKPVEAKLIDWQISRYASPVCDLMYYIFTCTDKQLRDKYYEEMLDVYYTSLTEFLRRLGSDPESLFPRKALNEQLTKFGSLALIMGVMLIPTITLKGDDIPDLDEISEKLEVGDEEFVTQAMQNKMPATMSKIRDVIVDVVKLGYI